MYGQVHAKMQQACSENKPTLGETKLSANTYSSRYMTHPKE